MFDSGILTPGCALWRGNNIIQNHDLLAQGSCFLFGQEGDVLKSKSFAKPTELLRAPTEFDYMKISRLNSVSFTCTFNIFTVQGCDISSIHDDFTGSIKLSNLKFL